MSDPGAEQPGGTEVEPTPLLHPADGVPELAVTARQIEAARGTLGPR